MLGAAGAVELIVSALSLKHGLIPPTGHRATPDPECALDIVTAPRALPLECVLSNSAGFGGCNAAAVLTRQRPAPHPPARSPQPPSVLITGLGVVSALGLDAEETASAFAEGEPALFPLTCVASQLFLAACGMAFRQAGVTADTRAGMQAGIMAGTAWGCPATAETFFADYILKGPRLVKPFLFPHAYANTAVSLASMEWALKGPHENVVTRATASGIALVEAFDQLRAGRAPLIAVCGADALSAVALNARHAAGDPAPMGEAAAALVLEREDAAGARGARPLGRLLGCGLAPTPENALQTALSQAGVPRDALRAAYVNAAARDAAEAGLPGTPVIEPERLCGDVQGATSALHLALGLLAPDEGPALILTVEPDTCVALVVERA
jgi:3-oxoacyl-[acyl-carrier-protein] synthase II